MLYRSFLVALITLALSLPVGAQVLINEVCADNASALSPGGTAADYVELYNSGTSAVSLNGWSLTDDPSVKNKYPFPSTASIPAKGFVVVWLDSVTNYAGLVTTNFSLRSSGEEVGLYQGSSKKDHIAFGPQIQDRSVCRIPDGGGTWTLGQPTPGKTNLSVLLGTVNALRINELLATNSAGSDWLELYNPPTNPPVAIGLMVFAQTNISTNLPALYPNSFIDAGGFLEFQCIGDTNRGDHLNFKLSSTLGETISLYASNRLTLIDQVSFGPQTRDMSYGRLPDGGTNFFLFSPTNRASPGKPNDWLALTNVVISEVLSHTDPPLEDAIELQNLSNQPLDISNWWLSNSRDEPLKFHIPAGTVIPAFGFKVFFEQVGSTTAGFNRSGTGNYPDFTINSAHGDQVVLTAGSSSAAVTGARSARDIPASANGVSFLRYAKSDGGSDMTPQSRRTFGVDNPASVADFRLSSGLVNAYPLVGPLVISEILYHPLETISGGITNDNTLDEFIEFTSTTNIPIPLYDPVYPTNTWHVEGGISFRFPMNVTVSANSSLLLVNFDPLTNSVQLAAFRARYGLSPAIPLFGPYSGKLQNSADTIELYKPDAVQLPPHPDAGYVPSILVEKVKYEQANGWPTSADGDGYSLHRLSFTGYANDQTNWFAALPSPGAVTPPGSAPQITSSPVSSALAAGATATFSAAFNGTAPLGLQWQFNGSNIPGASTNPLVMIHLGSAQEGAYTAIATNIYGTATSAVATLTVLRPPSILMPPASVTITQGSLASFSVLAEGTGPLNLQWRFNGNPLNGQTIDTLMLSSVQPSQAGGYDVLIFNAYGAVTSAVATLIVGVPPAVSLMSFDQFVAAGTTVSFTIVDSGTTPLSRQWLFNGANLPGATLPTLTLNHVQTNQSGLYQAVVTNAFGAATSSVVKLSVAGPPVLLPLTLATNMPHLTLSGPTGHVYELQGMVDFSNWLPLLRFTNSSGQQTVTDPSATNFPRRFYRARVVN